MEERLQKLLAAAGIASRRASETLILAGRVTVNGHVVRELGTRADPNRDDVRLDGQPVRRPEAHTYLLLHKPAGYTSTASDPHATHTVMGLLPPDTGRVFPVGRLDRDSEGLLLLTDDGEIGQRLLHPRYHLPKEYAVLVRGRLSEAILRKLRQGVEIEGKMTAPAEVEPGEPPRHLLREARVSPQPATRGRERATVGPSSRTFTPRADAAPILWLRFVLYEGRKRQIRALCTHAGLEVERLIRVRMGPLALGTLPAGKTRRLTAAEVAALRHACGLDAAGTPVPAGTPTRTGRPRPPRPAPKATKPVTPPRGLPRHKRRP